MAMVVIPGVFACKCNEKEYCVWGYILCMAMVVVPEVIECKCNEKEHCVWGDISCNANGGCTWAGFCTCLRSFPTIRKSRVGLLPLRLLRLE